MGKRRLFLEECHLFHMKLISDYTQRSTQSFQKRFAGKPKKELIHILAACLNVCCAMRCAPKPRNGYAQRFRLPLMNSKLSESQFYDCWLSTERKRKHFQIKSPNGCEKRRSVGRGEENDLSIFKRKGTKTPSEIIMLLLDNSSPTRKWTLKRDG